jgi:hypothetical protein
MGHPLRREVAELEAQNTFQDYIDEVASEPPNEVVAEAVAQAQEDHAANAEKAKLSAAIQAEREDELDQSILAEQDEQRENLEFEEMDSDPPPKPKPKRQVSNRLYVERQGGRFVLANSVKLIPGEVLYRHRPRSMGVQERFIKHSRVDDKHPNKLKSSKEKTK